MSSGRENKTMFIQTGNPETVQETDPRALGQLGQRIQHGNKEYQFVRVATATTTLAVHDLMYWSDKSIYEVTGDITASNIDLVAGRIGVAAVGDEYVFIQTQGTATVASTGTTAVGDGAVGSSTTNFATLKAAATETTIGVYQSTTAGGVATIDLFVPPVP